MERRLHREEVGQRRELLVGEALGELVQEADVVARRRPLILVHPLALLATAVGEVAVVLADGDDVHPRVGLEDRIHLGRNQLQHLGVGQTPLAGLSRSALSIDEGVVFGMLPAVDRGGEQLVEGMNPHPSGKDVAGLLQPQEVAVGLVQSHAVALALAVAEGRILEAVHRGQLDGRSAVNHIGVRRQVIYTEVALEQRYDAVERPLVAAR